MNTYTAKFPKIISTKINPIVDLYTKALKSVGLIFGEKKLDVTCFTVHPNDQKKVIDALTTYVANQYPVRTSKKKIKEIVGWTDLDIGPRVSEEVEEGTVSFIH